MINLYIGPGLGIGTIVLIFVIAGIVLFSFGYIFWLKFRKFFKKKKK
jgi:hypothetical protein